MAKKSAKKKQKTPEPAAPDPVLDSLRAEMLALLENELTPGSLHTLREYVGMATTAVMLRQPRARLGCTVPTANYGMSGGPVYTGYNTPPSPMGDNEADAGDNAASWMDRETFGAKMLRELIEALPSIARASREDPSQLVNALVSAREQGLTDIADELEQRLRGNYSLGRTINVKAP